MVIANIIIYICTSKSMKPFLRIFPLDMNQISGIISFSAEDTTKKTVHASPEFVLFLFFFDCGISSSLDFTLFAFPSSIFSQSSTFHSLNQTFWVRKWLYCNYNEHLLGNGDCLFFSGDCLANSDNYVMQYDPTT